MKKITKAKYLELLGCGVLVKRYVAILKELEQVMAELVGADDEGNGYFGHVTDSVYEDDPVSYIMDKMDIRKP